MSDPMSTNPVRADEPHDETDREARIEELLLSGLDHYFGGQYERAISVWTRIVFLDRHHDRARAYIERARSALAERQRESDECLHDGVVAYNAGEIDKARELLTRALEQGSDAAGVFLDRLNRVGPVGLTADAHPEPKPARAAPGRRRMPLAPRRRDWVAAGLAALVVAAMMLLSGLRSAPGSPSWRWRRQQVRYSPPSMRRCQWFGRLRPRCCGRAPCTPTANCTTQCARSNASTSAIPLARTPTGFEPTSSAISSRWQVFPSR